MLIQFPQKSGYVTGFTPDTGSQSSEPVIIGNNRLLNKALRVVEDSAEFNFPIHISGDTGTGKELIAEKIHLTSSRMNCHFVPVNCGALPESLIESELFGHVKGAFSGAYKGKIGRFELAHKGTLFLDEIAELPKYLQVKILRVLETGCFEKVGSAKTTEVDIKIISATNKNLLQETQLGNFREDLYYRLNVIPIHLPPLKDRKEDIPLLANWFLESITKTYKKPQVFISKESIMLMMQYDWPGNIRELKNIIQYSFVKCRGDIIKPKHLPSEITETNSLIRSGCSNHKLTVNNVLNELKKTDGNKAKAARNLGIGRATLYRFIKNNYMALE